MTKNELKSLVKNYFNLTENNSQSDIVEQNFAEATLADGTKIMTMEEGDFAVGQVLHVVTAEGEHVIAPSGEHTTDSGIVLTVDGEGMITGVKYPDAEGEGSLVEEMSAEEIAEEVISDAIEEGMTPDAVIEVVKEVIDAVIAPAIEEMKAKMAEMEEKMSQAFSSTPASEPTMQAKFRKVNEDILGKSFDFKAAQLESILSRNKK